MNIDLYNKITHFANAYGCHRFNDDRNHDAYMQLVDLCIKNGIINKSNRNEFSTHGCLNAAIIYESNRIEFCNR